MTDMTDHRLLRPAQLVAVAHFAEASARQQRFGHAGTVLWLTGLSAAGKSTLAMRLEEHLLALGYACFALDGDNIRRGLNADLGFSARDRHENIRRVGEVAALFAEAGFICIAAFISPFRDDRDQARRAAQRSSFHEIHLAASLAVCEARDPKGLYRQARAGQLRDFTGIDAPYEEPVAPELVIDTGSEPLEDSLQQLVAYVTGHFPLATAARPATPDLA
jgi:adenylyl-sulfate kinase